MWQYTISGVPATKFRVLGKSSKVWDEYSAAKMHYENQLCEQLGEHPKHHGLLEVDYTFYLPHTNTSINRAKKQVDVFADRKPDILLMLNFVQMMVDKFLLDKESTIVVENIKKLYHDHPATVIYIKPISHKK